MMNVQKPVTPNPTVNGQRPPEVFSPEKFFIGKELTIVAPPGHILTLAYADQTKDGECGYIENVKILSLRCNEYGEPKSGIIRYKEGRVWERTDAVSLDGCVLSLAERLTEEKSEPTKK